MKRLRNTYIYSLLILLPFLGIMLLQLVVRVKAIRDDYALYTAIFCGLMVLLILSSSLYPFKQGQKFKLKFSWPLLICWLGMCGFMLYSDIVIIKNYWFLSLILLILFTGLFIAWQQYSNAERDKLWSIIRMGIEVAFGTATIFCFLFRPYQNGIRYSGLSANPNVYAMFLVIVWICLLTRLDYMINEGVSAQKCIFTFAELGFALHFMYMTGARTSFLAISFTSALWFFFRLFLCRRKNQRILRYILIGFGCMAAAFIVSYAMLATIPHLINHPVTFERDRAFASIDTEYSVCLAADAAPEDTAGGALEQVENDVEQAIQNVENEPSLIKRISLAFQNGSDLDTILNGRLSIYRNYISKLNDSGHKKYGKKVDGTYVVNAHNNAIQIAYTYGKPAMIAYLLLNILSIIYSIRYFILFHDKKRNAVLPMLITASFLITSLTECIILPMQSLLAFAYYLSLGELMNSKKN